MPKNQRTLVHGIVMGLGLGIILLGPDPIISAILGLSLIALGFILERKRLKKGEGEKSSTSRSDPNHVAQFLQQDTNQMPGKNELWQGCPLYHNIWHTLEQMNQLRQGVLSPNMCPFL